jgi:hypothetical protein
MASGVPLSCERISGKPNVLLYTDTSGTAAYYKGDLVRLDASGTLVLGAAGAATASAGILGIAMMTSPGDTTTKVPVDIITADGSLFVMKCTSTTAATSNGDTMVVTFTAGAQTVADGSTNPSFVQVGLWDAAGATKARVILKPIATCLQSVIGWT